MTVPLITVLALSSDPITSSIDRLEEDVEFLEERLSKDLFRIHKLFSSDSKEISKKIKQVEPDVLFFSGNGSDEGELLFENNKDVVKRLTASEYGKILGRANFFPEWTFLCGCRPSKSNERAFGGVTKNYVRIDGLERLESGYHDLAAEVFEFLSSHDRKRPSVQGLKDEISVRVSGMGFSMRVYQRLEAEKNEDDEPQIRRTIHPISNENVMTFAPEWKEVDGDSPYFAVSNEKHSEDEFEEMRYIKAVPTKKQPKVGKVFKLWYGTNRKPNGDDKRGVLYGSDRDKKLNCGTCHVAIPDGHKMGQVGGGFLNRLNPWKDNRLRVIDRTSSETDEFWESLRESVLNIGVEERDSLVFIHGYNVSFDEAAIRAAQLGFDLKIGGATGFFSWPSKARTKCYTHDEATIQASEPFLKEYLERFIDRSGSERVHLIAHSMGNRGLLRASNNIVNGLSTEAKKRINQIVLAAPDVDAQVFEQLARTLVENSKRVTLYACDKDKAVRLSKFFHGFHRAGYMPPPTVVSGIDTVSASELDLDLVGHGYFAANMSLLSDIYSLIHGDLDPGQRFGISNDLDSITGMSFWKLLK